MPEVIYKFTSERDERLRFVQVEDQHRTLHVEEFTGACDALENELWKPFQPTSQDREATLPYELVIHLCRERQKPR